MSWDGLLNAGIDFLNYIILGIGTAISFVVKIFPASPFQTVTAPAGKFLNYLCWVLPVDVFVLHLGVFLSAILIYYAVSIIARWLKVVSG